MSDFSLQHVSFSLVWPMGSVIVAGRLSCQAACEILVPPPGIDSVFSILEGRFLTSGWSGKSLLFSVSNSSSTVILCLFVCLFVCLVHGPRQAGCGILVLHPGFEPKPPAVEARSLNYWTTREVLILFVYWPMTLLNALLLLVFLLILWAFLHNLAFCN